VNPYEGDLAMIGTPDIPYEGRAEDVAIDDAETSVSAERPGSLRTGAAENRDIGHSFSGL